MLVLVRCILYRKAKAAFAPEPKCWRHILVRVDVHVSKLDTCEDCAEVPQDHGGGSAEKPLMRETRMYHDVAHSIVLYRSKTLLGPLHWLVPKAPLPK